MIEDDPNWGNSVCSGCGIVLPGDPRPDPPQSPFTAEDRIECPAR